MPRKTIQEQVDSLKTRKDKLFYALSLRDDLAQLIAVGLERNNMTQRELSRIAGYSKRSESYISRLANAATNFKIGVAARVLIPLGIRPMLVDKAEWDKLKKAAQRAGSCSITDETSQNEPARSTATADRVIVRSTTPTYWVEGGDVSPAARVAYALDRSRPRVYAKV